MSKPAHSIVKELDMDSGAILQNLVKGKGSVFLGPYGLGGGGGQRWASTLAYRSNA